MNEQTQQQLIKEFWEKDPTMSRQWGGSMFECARDACLYAAKQWMYSKNVTQEEVTKAIAELDTDTNAVLWFADVNVEGGDLTDIQTVRPSWSKYNIRRALEVLLDNYEVTVSLIENGSVTVFQEKQKQGE